MKYFKLKQIALALAMVVLAVSCIEDSEPTPRTFASYGFLTKMDNTYYVDMDGGMKVQLMPFDDSDIELTGIDRVLFQFTVEEEYDISSPVKYLVNLQGLMFVDYSHIVTLNDVSRDTIGEGIVNLQYNYESDLNSIENYLNLVVNYKKQEGNHVFSLCYDPNSQTDGEPIVLELKNKQPEEGFGGQLTRSYQSFNISNLMGWGQLDEDGKMEFILRINSGDSQEQDFELTYAPFQE